jgi:hypothetical protein
MPGISGRQSWGSAMKLKSGVVIASVLAALLCAPWAQARAPSGTQKKAATAKKQNQSTTSSTITSTNMSGGGSVTLASVYFNPLTTVNPLTGYPYAVTGFNSDGVVSNADLQALLMLLKQGGGESTDGGGSLTDGGAGTLNLSGDSTSSGVWNTMSTGADLQGFINYLKPGAGTQSVPEPASVVLAVCGFAGLFLAWRRSS